MNASMYKIPHYIINLRLNNFNSKQIILYLIPPPPTLLIFNLLIVI